MSKALELRQERSTLVKEMKDLVEKNAKLSDAQESRWKELDDKQKGLKETIDRLDAVDALDSELSKVRSADKPQIETRYNPSTIQNRAKQLQESDEYRSEYATYLRRGSEGDLMREMRTYAGLGDAVGATGVTLVPTGFQKNLEVKLKAIGGPRQVAQVITTATGNILHWPTMDDTGNTGTWVAEASPVSQTNPTMSEVTLAAFLGSSDQVLVSVQLLQDSAFDPEAFLADAFATRLGRLTNTAYTTGNGTGQPTGIVYALNADGTRSVSATGANSNSGNAADTEVNSIGSDDLDALIAAVDPAYRPGSAFMSNQSTFDGLRKVKDKYGRSLWAAGLAEKEPDTIRGYRYIYDQAMAAVAASANSMVFGDFSKYIIRDVLGFQLVRFNELYMANHQVGFQAYLRTDAKLLQPAAFSLLHHPLS